MLFYAYGGKAPSAKDVPDRWLYEMALDLRLTPDQIRAMNPRDRNKLVLIRDARNAAVRQRNQNF